MSPGMPIICFHAIEAYKIEGIRSEPITVSNRQAGPGIFCDRRDERLLEALVIIGMPNDGK